MSTFNANTFRFEYPDIDENAPLGEFGFSIGSLEHQWMLAVYSSLISLLLREFPNCSLSPGKVKKDQFNNVPQVILTTGLNRAYDVLFQLMELKINYIVSSTPKALVYSKYTIPNSTEIRLFEFHDTLIQLPIDEAVRRLIIGGSSIPIILGPLIPILDEETGNVYSWRILITNIKKKIVDGCIQRIHIGEMKKQSDLQKIEDPLNGVSIVTDRQWALDHIKEASNINHDILSELF